MTFHRLSFEPVSPYAGRPQVLGASCDGTGIDITWDRPVNGWDFIIKRTGVGLPGYLWADTNNFSYDPISNTFHIQFLPTIPLIAGLQYTVSLEDGYYGVDWHDPYGAPAWDNPANAYTFDFISP